MIDLQEFVRITIGYQGIGGVSSQRNTAALFCVGEAQWPFATDDVVVIQIAKTNGTMEATVEGVSQPVDITNLAAKNYLQVFFDNGGVKLHLIKLTDQPSEADIKKLPSTEIMIASTGTQLETLSGLASKFLYDEGINEKIFVAQSTTLPESPVSVDNLALKIGPAGCQMATLAYYTRLDVYSDEIKDYSFTIENLTSLENAVITNNDIMHDALANNYNCDVTLAGATRNVGGNITNGVDLTNAFTKIVMVQTLTNRLISLLVSKIPYNSIGISKISGAITSELQSYVENGFLATDRIYDGNDLYYKGQLIISNGTIMPLGYKFVILPFSTLTAAERQAHQLPDIYLVLAEGYSIRKIVITGEVF